ncbi:MAG: CBS domain-containing protein [Chloroflexi bacterium]|nr:CBS domain-containing protein [Chloroflexota bacterium]MCL5075244.1 CBS domain-containing protein [Chloroflexota bacterium]
MLFISQILNHDVQDSEGCPLGKLKDLIISTTVPYPEVIAIVIAAKQKRQFILPWNKVANLEGPDVRLSKPLDTLASYEPSESDIWLARDVLDKQIVATDGTKVVRANDLQLARVNAHYRLVGVDISLHGLVRRLGWEGSLKKITALLKYELPEHYIAWEDVDPIEINAAGVKLKVPHAKITRLHPADIAEIIAKLDRHTGDTLIQSLDNETVADTLEQFEPDLQASVIQSMDNERAADILEAMAPDDAADVLAELSKEKSEELLHLMNVEEAEDVRELLAYPEDSAGGVMTSEFVTFPPDLTAQQAINRLRELAPEPDIAQYIYVTDEEGHLLGVFSLYELIVAKPDSRLADFMTTSVVKVNVYDKQEEAAKAIAKYNLLALPVVDDQDRLQGIVTVDDAIDIILPTAWKKRLPRLFG